MALIKIKHKPGHTPKDYVKMLKRKHGAIATTSVATVNKAAKLVETTYKKELRKFTLRNKFTMGAVKLFKSKAKRSAGGFRKIEDINAIVGVRKMKGGKEHYLLKQDIGGTKKGLSKTLGKVAIPLDVARSGQSHGKPIKSALRLQNVGSLQTLKVAGKQIGTPNSSFSRSQSWAILWKHRKDNRYGWDLGKQFLFQTLSGVMGIFKKAGRGFKKIRNLDNRIIKIKATRKFQRAIEKLTPVMMEAIFKREARKFLDKK